MNCPKCNFPASPGTVYCINCGSPLRESPAPQIRDNELIRIGRGRDNDVHLKDDMVSRHHALLRKQQDGTWRLEDLSSKNGTFVNERRITAATISPSDRIRFGAVTVSAQDLISRSPTPAYENAAEETRVKIQHNFDTGEKAKSTATFPAAVKYIVIYNVVNCILVTVIALFTQSLVNRFIPQIFTYTIFVILVNGFLSYKLYKLRNWSRIVYIILYIIGILYIILIILGSRDVFSIFCGLYNIIGNILCVYYLCKSSVSCYFKNKQK